MANVEFRTALFTGQEDGLEVLHLLPVEFTPGDAAPERKLTGDPKPFDQVFGETPVPRIADWRLKQNIESAKARGWRNIEPGELAGRRVALCGGGWSLGTPQIMRELRRVVTKKKAIIATMNRTHDWLFTKGFTPWSASLMDPMPWVADYIKPRKGVRYFVGSQCHEKTLDVFDRPEIDKRLWHCLTTGVEREVLTPEEQKLMTLSETSTVGLRLFHKFYQLGCSAFDWFGFDSCYDISQIDLTDPMVPKVKPNGSLHAYHKPETIHDVIKIVSTDPLGREHVYYSNANMAQQAMEFRKLPGFMNAAMKTGKMRDISIYVHGTGIIPDMAASLGWHYELSRNLEYCRKAA